MKAQKDLVHAYILGGGWHTSHLGDVKLVHTESDSKRIMKLLQLNRVDVYIEQSLLVNYQIKLLGYGGQVVQLPAVMDHTDWHLCVSKKSPFKKIMVEFNAMMDQLQSDGTLQKLRSDIFKKYQYRQ